MADGRFPSHKLWEVEWSSPVCLPCSSTLPFPLLRATLLSEVGWWTGAKGTFEMTS